MRCGRAGRYHEQHGIGPPVPKEGIACYYFQRTLGKVGVRVDVILSPAVCRKFKIWMPMSLDKAKVGRIDKWNKKQALLQE